MLKKAISSIFYLLFLTVSVLILLEISYRFYLVDFYGGNLKALNPPSIFEDSKAETILILGDSFSADQDSYVRMLRDSFPKKRIINSAVPGTCIRQHQLMFSDRLAQFKPDLFIYQMYVGNDLFEWRHPLNRTQISFTRNIYWWLSDHIWALGYINARLPYIRQAFRQNLPTTVDPKDQETFSIEQYSARTKLQFKAAPKLIERSVTLSERRYGDMEQVTHQLSSMLAQLPDSCQVIILVMPHCMQLGAPYLERGVSLGAKVSRPGPFLQLEYPMIQYLKNQVSAPRVQLINPLGALRIADKKQAVYYQNDPHLNPFGQRVVGELFVPIIK